MRMFRPYFKCALFYLLDLLGYCFIFLLIYCFKRFFSPGSIIFYEGILLSIVIPFIYFAMKIKLKLKRDFKDLLVYAMLSYSFIITIPTLIERSISILLIGSLAVHYPVGLTQDTLNSIFLKNYVKGNTQIIKRIDEQIKNGNVIKVDNSYILTLQGYRYALLNRRLAYIFNLDQEYVDPK
jgi:hypothetical protein